MCLSHSWCVDILSEAAQQDGVAASRREERKVNPTRLVRSGANPNFVPPVMENFGCLGSDAQNLLSQLLQLCKDIDLDNAPQNFKCATGEEGLRSHFNSCSARVHDTEEDLCSL